MSKLYRDFATRAQIDAEYDVERSVPDFMHYARQYADGSTVARRTLGARLGLRYDFAYTFLDLSDVALNLSIEKGAFSVSLEGGLGGAFRKGGKPVDVVIDLAVEDKKLTVLDASPHAAKGRTPTQ